MKQVLDMETILLNVWCINNSVAVLTYVYYIWT